MINTRHARRINSSEKCALHLSGTSYQCRLDNVSLDGVQVNCIGFLREVWPGDKGVLHLADRPEGVSCQVTHIAAAKIGLKFDH